MSVSEIKIPSFAPIILVQIPTTGERDEKIQCEVAGKSRKLTYLTDSIKCFINIIALSRIQLA